MSKSYYRVDSFHINVGQGDGAIHILSSGDTPEDGTRTVEQAFFVDGGVAFKGRVRPTIKDTISRIMIKFKCQGDPVDPKDQNSPKKLLFDAFVVTHWDADHFEGILDLFYYDILKQLDDGVPDPKLSWAKGPDTLFICTETKITKAKRHYSTYVKKEDRKLYMTIKNQDIGILKVKSHVNELLGQNFFNFKDALSDDVIEGIKSPAELIAANKPDVKDPNPEVTSDQKPGMYCIAMNSWSLGGPKPYTATNKSSICMIIMWSNGRISHYFAGDAHDVLERRIARWVGTGTEVTSMKLSHHGAKSSTPIQLLQNFQPWNIVVSAGRKRSYGHPRWELLVLIDLVRMQGSGKKLLLMTQYPYYLVQDKDGNHESVVGFLTDLGKGVGLRKVCDPLLEEINKARKDNEQLSSLFKDYDVWRENLPKEPNYEKKEEKLRQLVSQLVNDLAYHTDSLDWLPSCGVSTGKNGGDKVAMYESQITSVRVASQGDDSTTEMGEGSTVVSHPYRNEKVLPWFKHIASIRSKPVLQTFRAINASRPGGNMIHRFKDPGNDSPIKWDLSVVNKPGGKFEGFKFDQRESSPGETVNNSSLQGLEKKAQLTRSGQPVDYWRNTSISSTRSGTRFILRDEEEMAALSVPSGPSGTAATNNPGNLLFQESVVSTYFVSETLEANYPVESRTIFVRKGHSLFGFVDSLHFRLFCLVDYPTTSQATPFSADDDWYTWFRMFFTWGSSDEPVSTDEFQMTMTPRAWPLTVNTRLDFSLSVPFLSGGLLKMSTLSAKDVFSNSNVDEKSLERMLTERLTMVFGLDSNPKDPEIKTTFGEVCKLIGLNMGVCSAFKQLHTKQLTLDVGSGKRNVMWFRPSTNYEMFLRLQFRIDPAEFNKWLGQVVHDVEIDQVLVIARKEANHSFSVSGDTLEHRPAISFLAQFKIGATSFDASVDIGRTNVELQLTTPSSFVKGATDGSALDDILNWCSEKLKLEPMPLHEWLKSADEAFDRTKIVPRQVRMILDLNDDGNIKGIGSVYISLEICLKIGKPKNQTKTTSGPLVCLLVFGWRKYFGPFLRGTLWFAPPPSPYGVYEKALPKWEAHNLLKPMTQAEGGSYLYSLNLKTLMSEDTVKWLPKGIPTNIIESVIELNAEEISFHGTIRCSDPDPDDIKSRPPKLALDMAQLSAGYRWKPNPEGGRGFHIGLRVDILLFKDGESDTDIDLEEKHTAQLIGQMKYENDSWMLSADVYYLTISHIASFWHEDVRKDVIDFMGNIEIDHLHLEYQYEKIEGRDVGLGKNFVMVGQLSLSHVLKLQLRYQNSGGNDWSFEANLAAGTQDIPHTIGDIMKNVVDADELKGLPQAILKTQLGCPEPGHQHQPFRLLVARHGDMTIFAMIIKINNISLWFLQFRRPRQPLKRLVKATLSKISVNTEPFGIIDSPFEQLFFLWAQDKSAPTSKVPVPGVLWGDFKLLRACLKERANLSEADFLLFKPSKKEKEDPEGELFKEYNVYKDDDTVIAAGSHFVVVTNNASGNPTVVLDHAFGKPKQPPPKRLSYYETDPDSSDLPEKGSKAPFKVTLGPLSVENIGLWYKEGTLGITLDATFVLGPLGLALMGFSISVPFDEKHNIANPPKIEDVKWDMAGLVVSLSKPPLNITGTFMREMRDGVPLPQYLGGVVFGYKPWMFEAMGVYATVDKKALLAPSNVSSGTLDMTSNSLVPFQGNENSEKEKTFTFAFIICKLNGPIFSVSFAECSSLIAGFGVNSDITLPTVEQVVNFPFVRDRNKEYPQNPIDTMKNLMQETWFRPAEGLFWAAAGLRFTAFQMLSVDAVLVLQFASDIRMGIYGIATCEVPSLTSSIKFAHMEIGIVSTLDPQSGVFKLEAQLSPRSYILSEKCHLTGGMALYSWFKDDVPNNVIAGNWVLTIGGYHQAFTVPPHYPRPERLRINWSLNSYLSVTGEAYFAITPKVCMGGGRLHAALKRGKLEAYFNAFLDFLINFQPFHFQIQVQVSVGVRYTVDMWIVSRTFNAEVGASLYITGPPFGGIVKVNFMTFTFSVEFGRMTAPPRALDLREFWDMVLKLSAGSTGGLQPSTMGLLQKARSSDERDRAGAQGEAFLLTCESGLEPGGSTEAEKNSKWFVRAGSFSFLVTFRFAINTGKLKENKGGITKEKDFPIGAEQKEIFARPMQCKHSLYSEATIDIDLATMTKKPSLENFSTRDMLLRKNEKEKEWRITPVIKHMQTSIWGEYKLSLDPSRSGNHVKQLLDNKDQCIPLVMGLSIAPREPSFPDDQINDFNVIEDNKVPVYVNKDAPHFPEREKANKAWKPQGKASSWDEVKDAWKSPDPPSDPERVVKLWASRMGFESNSIVGKKSNSIIGKKPNGIVGKKPEQLLSRFEKMVPAPPSIAVGVHEVKYVI